jgi:maleate cis-trans isomerase
MTTLVHDPVRLALVVPGDCHVDDELWSLAAPDAIPYVSRTRGASDAEMGRDGIAETTALAEGPEIDMAAERLRDVGPAVAAYVDTSISFVRGPEGDAHIAERLRHALACPGITTSSAATLALTALGVRRMAVLSPYTPELDARLARYFLAHGVETHEVVTLERSYPAGATSRELGLTRPADLLAQAERLAPGADGLFIPCTALRTLGAIEPLERALGVPVVSAIGATLWAVLRMAGITDARPGAGSLFEHGRLPKAPARPPLAEAVG